MPQGPLVTAMLVRYATGYSEVDSGGNVINSVTGRPAYTGPNGEPGVGYPPTAFYNTAWQMPDGRVAYYHVGDTPDPGNVQGLANWNRQHVYGRVEGFLSLGSTQSLADAQSIAQAVVNARSVPSITVTVGMEPAGTGDTPYTAFGVGDTLTGPDEIGNALRMRVMSMSVTEDDMGNPTFVPELNTPSQLTDLAQQRWLKRMSNGTIGGLVQSASPAPSSSPAAPSTASAAGGLDVIFDFPGPAYVVASDPVRPKAAGATTAAQVTALTAGTSDGSYDILKNGSVVGTVTLPSGQNEGSQTFSTPYTPTDVFQARCTTPGSGSAGVTVQLRGS